MIAFAGFSHLSICSAVAAEKVFIILTLKEK